MVVSCDAAESPCVNKHLCKQPIICTENQTLCSCDCSDSFIRSQMTLSLAFSSNKLGNKLLVTINDLIEYILLYPLFWVFSVWEI